MGDKTPEFTSNAPDFVELLKWEKDGKTIVKIGKTDVFHIFEFENK